MCSLEYMGGTVIGVAADVANRNSMQALADSARTRFGAIHLLFNNAGVTVFGSVETLSQDDWEWSLGVNLYGIEAFLPHMLVHGEPANVVNTSSFAGMVPSVHLAPYNVAKAGIVARTETLRQDLWGRNVGATVLCPMRVATRIWASSQATRPEEFGGGEAYRSRSSEETAQMTGDILDADDVAVMVLQAIRRNQAYVLPHKESREIIRHRSEKIDKSFDN